MFKQPTTHHGPPTHPRSAFTRTDLVCLIGAITLLSSIWLFAQQRDPVRERQVCINHLKIIGLAFRIWSNDNNDKFPMLTNEKQGGSLQAVKEGATFKHFQVIDEELQKVNQLVCPADTRKPAADFKSLRNDNLSYFVGVDADETRPHMFLAGDRNITNSLLITETILELPANKPAGWTGSMHDSQGHVGLSDGSVHFVNTLQLRDRIGVTTDARNRVQLPEVGSGSGEE